MSHPVLRLLPYFRRSPVLVPVGVIGLLVGAALSLTLPWLVGQAIDGEIAAGDVSRLKERALTCFFVLAGNLVITYAARLSLEIAAQRAMYALKTELFDHLVHHDLALHDRHPSGKLITRVQGDTEALRLLFAEVVLAWPGDVALFLGMLVVLVTSSPQIAPVTFAVLPVYLILFLLFRRIAPPRFLLVRKLAARLTGFLSEHVRAMPTLQAFGQTEWARDCAEERSAEVFSAEFKAGLVPTVYFNALGLVRNLGIALLLWQGALKIAAGTLSFGALVMGLGYLRLMFAPLMRLSHQLATLERAGAAAKRIAELVDTPPLIADPEDPKPWPGLKGALALEDVSFHYTEGLPVLQDVNLRVEAGTHVGIVGATGAGKSTILNLLLRFRDPSSGRVSIDGVDLRELRVEELRRHVGLVLQDVHLIRGTILENLGGEPDAARRALNELGLHFDLGKELREGGQNLSRGERQLLTFARALIGDPDLLVLDEATSAIDPATEDKVQAAMALLQQGRTTVTVAHRLRTVRHCDCIHVLSAGRVVESGDHDSLMAQDGVYCRLVRLQQQAAA